MQINFTFIPVAHWCVKPKDFAASDVEKNFQRLHCNIIVPRSSQDVDFLVAKFMLLHRGNPMCIQYFVNTLPICKMKLERMNDWFISVMMAIPKVFLVTSIWNWAKNITFNLKCNCYKIPRHIVPYVDNSWYLTWLQWFYMTFFYLGLSRIFSLSLPLMYHHSQFNLGNVSKPQTIIAYFR